MTYKVSSRTLSLYSPVPIVPPECACRATQYTWPAELMLRETAIFLTPVHCPQSLHKTNPRVP